MLINQTIYIEKEIDKITRRRDPDTKSILNSMHKEQEAEVVKSEIRVDLDLV